MPFPCPYLHGESWRAHHACYPWMRPPWSQMFSELASVPSFLRGGQSSRRRAPGRTVAMSTQRGNAPRARRHRRAYSLHGESLWSENNKLENFVFRAVRCGRRSERGQGGAAAPRPPRAGWADGCPRDIEGRAGSRTPSARAVYTDVGIADLA